MMYQPRIIKPLERIHQAHGPTIELTPDEAAFCRDNGYWPTRSELHISNPSDADMEMIQALQAKVKHLKVVIKTTENGNI